MLPLLILAVSALLLTLALTPACRALCTRLGWVDKPDLRKVHRAPIPRAGGIVSSWAMRPPWHCSASLRCGRRTMSRGRRSPSAPSCRLSS